MLVVLGPALAQQRPQYSQYMLNNYLLNPALTGIEDYADVRFGHRQQWVGLEGAPVTYYVSAHMPVGKASYPGPEPGPGHWQHPIRKIKPVFDALSAPRLWHYCLNR